MIYKERINRQRELDRQQEHWNEVHENLLAVQKKSLEISDSNDADEKEADAVARKVVDGQSAEIHGTGGTINRKGEGSTETSPEFQSKLESNKGSGQLLDDSTKSEMESKMGADFSGVKIHTGSEAHNMSESINAKAFTHGQDVFFKQGEFNTDSKQGKELLAHELTHTVQQGSGKIQPKVQRFENIVEDLDVNPGKTNYRFDTYKISASDLKDVEIVDRLQNLSLINKLVYFDKITDPDVKNYIDNLITKELSDTNAFLEYMGAVKEEDFIFIVFSLEKSGLLGNITASITPDILSAHDSVIKHLQDVRGITAIENRFDFLLKGTPDAAASREVTLTLKVLSLNRQKVIIFWLLDNNLYAQWRDNISEDDKATLNTDLIGFDNIKAEYDKPGFNAVEASEGKSTAVFKILGTGSSAKKDKFVDIVNGRSYRDDIIEKLDKFIEAQYPRSVTLLGGTKFDWNVFELIANEAKKWVDALYGKYATGPALTHTGNNPNLRDRSVEKDKKKDIKDLVVYLINTQSEDDIPNWTRRYGNQTIHEAHNADPSRKKEARIINGVKNDYAKLNKSKLEIIDQGWPGESSGGNISMQLFRKASDEENRRMFWRTFQTMLHEYLHTITNPFFETAAENLGGIREDILVEGGTSYFTDQVWNTIYPDEIRSNDQFRMKIEGGKYPYDETVIPTLENYEQIKQIQDMVPVIGEENLRAAYFLGFTEAAGIG